MANNPYYAKAGRGRNLAFKTFLSNKDDYPYAYKTDVKSYYASIDQQILLENLAPYIPASVLKIVAEVINPVIHVNGVWHQSGQGIPVGCALSPVLAEFYLSDLDRRFADDASRHNYHYQRYVDDILVLARSNHALKRAVKTVKTVLSKHGLTTRYKKTFVGRLNTVLAYLGYRVFANGTVGVSRESLARRRLNLLQRKAQGATEEELCSYKKRWLQSFSMVAG